jgi:rSAM/selenodomain-associated transferase 2
MLSAVIPTLNAAAGLRACVDSLAEMAGEVVVADGGSTDATRQIAESCGAAVIRTPPGRGLQLAAGAAAARGNWLLFLHADTRLEPAWAEEARAFMAERSTGAAVFRFALDDPAPQARRIERMATWRARALALPYGDQGLLLSRRLYDQVGGFRPLPLMEDVDIVRRLGRARLNLLRARAFTSAARYRRDGWTLRPARNLACLSLYLLGAPPKFLARLYG